MSKMSTGTTTNGGTTPTTPHPTPGVTPPKLSIPQVFASAEARLSAWATVWTTHLQSLTLPMLQKLQAALNAGTALPFGLEIFRADVVAYIGDAIAYVTDAATLLQLVEQLTAIKAANVDKPTAS